MEGIILAYNLLLVFDGSLLLLPGLPAFFFDRRQRFFPANEEAAPAVAGYYCICICSSATAAVVVIRSERVLRLV